MSCLWPLFLLGGTAAEAHPHVWITASSELLYAADGSITAVRHAWTFDDMFAAYPQQGTESKKAGVYTREELAPPAPEEYAYFTFARADGKKNSRSRSTTSSSMTTAS